MAEEKKVIFTVDGVEVEAREGQSVIQACDAAGIYIPRLCHHPDLPPGGHCRLCVCMIDGRPTSACTKPVSAGMAVVNNSEELNENRRTLLKMLFVEGNHICPNCEKSGDCELQALAYRLEVHAPDESLTYLWQKHEIDASHPDVMIDRNTCILCRRCVRASELEDGKTVFGFYGRGISLRLNIDATTGLKDTELKAADKAAQICPVGCIVIKRHAYLTPIGERLYDANPIGEDIEKKRAAHPAEAH